MKINVSDRDLELLSAYLDQELSPKERSYVEARLQSNPSLRSILGELHQNRAALRSLPRLRAPRNFTLSPELVGIKPKKRTYPVFGLVSALSSLLLILVLMGDFLMKPPMPSQPIVEQEVLVEAPAEGAQDTELFMEKAVEETPSILPAEQPTIVAEAEMATETEMVEALLRAQGGGGESTEETSVGIESLSSLNPQGTATPSMEEISSTATPSAVPPTNTPKIPPPMETTEITIEDRIESVVPSTPVTIEPQPSQPIIPPIRIFEISLAAITLISGLIALYLRTKSR